MKEKTFHHRFSAACFTALLLSSTLLNVSSYSWNHLEPQQSPNHMRCIPPHQQHQQLGPHLFDDRCSRQGRRQPKDQPHSAVFSDSSNQMTQASSFSLSSRRRWISSNAAATTALALATFAPLAATAAIVESAASSTAASSSSTDPMQAEITDKVFFDVRISRKDGTFYQRDDLDETDPDNRVFTGRLIIGLFGKNAPTHVHRFLSYCQRAVPLDDNPLPSYGRSLFPKLDQATGLLTGGYIPSLQVTNVNGSPAIQYGGRLLPAALWMERNNNSSPQRLSHTAKGLLTHRQLDVTPVFGITTRKDSYWELDGAYTVFGRILLDESSTQFLQIVQDLPTYSMDRPAASLQPGGDFSSSSSSSSDMSSSSNYVLQDAASAVFTAQRDFFRKAAKTFGDTRLDKIYEGKILRRVEVTQVGIL